MEMIAANGYDIKIGEINVCGLNNYLKENYAGVKKYIMLDGNTLKHCFPYIAQHCPELNGAEIIELESGEQHKTIETCMGVWQALSELNASRSDVIINLGGGVISDMGGFIAATFKRGMQFINIPTTLLSQVDASVGGKVGVDLDNAKNLIGLIANPEIVYIDGNFLRTLPSKELNSGLAECIKHGLVADKAYFHKILTTDFTSIEAFIDLIEPSVRLKNKIVAEDPYEQAHRKKLNFGHTIGHAIEAYSMESELKHLLHGEAIAIGMICESFLSFKKGLLQEEALNMIATFILSRYPEFVMNEVIYHRLIEFMRKDKKNQGGNINFTLLKNIGDASINHTFEVPEIFESLAYYQTLISHA